MNPPDEQTAIDNAILIIQETVELKKDIDGFRQAMKVDFAEINATLDRIDGHVQETAQMMKRTTSTLESKLRGS
jgi:DNA-binding NtrC family response regulator